MSKSDRQASHLSPLALGQEPERQIHMLTNPVSKVKAKVRGTPAPIGPFRPTGISRKRLLLTNRPFQMPLQTHLCHKVPPPRPPLCQLGAFHQYSCHNGTPLQNSLPPPYTHTAFLCVKNLLTQIDKEALGRQVTDLRKTGMVKRPLRLGCPVCTQQNEGIFAIPIVAGLLPVSFPHAD